MQKDFINQVNRLKLTNNYILSIDSKNNSLVLNIENLSDENRKTLEGYYGDAITINIDSELTYKAKSEVQSYKIRKSDYNSQGAGIGIQTKFVQNQKNYSHHCSTAGVAKKDSNYWVITAGHCDDNSRNLLSV